MVSAEENLQFVLLLLKQKMENNILTGIDWSAVATHLGVTQKAASNRWHRLKQDLIADGLLTPGAGGGSKKVEKKPAAPKKAKNPKDKADKSAPIRKAERAVKKRKVEEIDEEDDDGAANDGANDGKSVSGITSEGF